MIFLQQCLAIIGLLVQNEYIKIKLFDIMQRQYSIKQIDFSNGGFSTSHLSNNEKYLAYGGCEQKLKIYDVQNDQITRELKVKSFIQVCTFTLDSSQLFVGCFAGQLYGYDVSKNFKQIYRQKLYQINAVTYLRTIQNQFLITTSYETFIKKIDIKSKKLIFKINLTRFIYAIDCSINDLIIGGYPDKSIKLWNCGNRSIMIDKQNAHPDKIEQINFINNNQNVLVLDSQSNLYKWRIDLNNKDFVKIQEIKAPNQIYSFNPANQNQNILLICSKFLYIIDDQKELVNQIQHYSKILKQSEFFRQSESRQLDNLNYIHIRSFNKIMLAKALN